MKSLTQILNAGHFPRRLKVTVQASRGGYRLFAPLYDLVFGMSLEHGRRLAIQALGCAPGDRVLEVGVGSGLSLPLYPESVRICGIDTSQEMLAKAAQLIRRRRIKHVETLLQMDAEQMTFDDASFDKAIVLFAVSGLPNPIRAMREIQRVCRPGATIVIANHFQSPQPVLRACDFLLSPIYRLLRYRDDLDLAAFVAASGLNVTATYPANLFGYSTILVCRNTPRDILASKPTSGSSKDRGDACEHGVAVSSPCRD